MEETGLKKLMKDLGVKDFKELNEYINNPLHREEAIVIEFKKFLEYLKNKGEELWKTTFITILIVMIRKNYIV